MVSMADRLIPNATLRLTRIGRPSLRPGRIPANSLTRCRRRRHKSPSRTTTIQTKRPKSLANRRGRNWSLPLEAKISIPVSRSIDIECRGDRLVILPDHGNPQPQMVRVRRDDGGRRRQLVDRSLAAYEGLGHRRPQNVLASGARLATRPQRRRPVCRIAGLDGQQRPGGDDADETCDRGPENIEAAGQDSFVDVVTNLVGIMIVLVIIVGVRTKHVCIDPAARQDAAAGRDPCRSDACAGRLANHGPRHGGRRPSHRPGKSPRSIAN